MALRRSEFIPVLERHEYSQQVEGYCWPALLAGSLDSYAGNGQRTNVFALAEELQTTKKFGNSNLEVAEFLAKRGIAWYAETDCPTERLLTMLAKLPSEVDLFASVFDWRARPGYNLKRDRPEPHLVAPIAVVDSPSGKVIRYYDPDSVIGGLLPCPLELWSYWHHEGPAARPGENRQLQLDQLDDPSVGFVMLAGISTEGVYRIVGCPR